MKNPRKTLIYLFLAYHLLFVIGALYIDARQDDLGFLLSVKGYLPWMKYYAIIGLILFVIAYIVVLRDTRSLRKSVNQAKEEHTLLKAKLFDFQEASNRASDSPGKGEILSTTADKSEGNEGSEEDKEDKDTGGSEDRKTSQED